MAYRGPYQELVDSVTGSSWFWPILNIVACNYPELGSHSEKVIKNAFDHIKAEGLLYQAEHFDLDARLRERLEMLFQMYQLKYVDNTAEHILLYKPKAVSMKRPVGSPAESIDIPEATKEELYIGDDCCPEHVWGKKKLNGKKSKTSEMYGQWNY